MRACLEADRGVSRWFAAATALVAVLCALSAAASARAADYVPGVVVVGYSRAPAMAPDEARLASAGSSELPSATGSAVVVHTPRGVSVSADIRRLRHEPGVAYAVPDYIATTAAATTWIPNDPGRAHVPGGWQRMQWNFLAADGVDAP